MDDAIQDDTLFDDALAVARLTMKRARKNVEQLYAKLIELGYTFAFPKDAFIPADPPARAKVVPQIERIFGQLPLSLRCWFEEVGEVNFVGDHPRLGGYGKYKPYFGNMELLSDPLMVYIWEFTPQHLHRFTPDDFMGYIDFSADDLHKAAFSGSGSPRIVLPSQAIDGEVDTFGGTFVEYVRWNFAWGGFPGFEKHTDPQTGRPNDEWNPMFEYPTTELAYLKANLLPI